jgi:hypothetical protein
MNVIERPAAFDSIDEYRGCSAILAGLLCRSLQAYFADSLPLSSGTEIG